MVIGFRCAFMEVRFYYLFIMRMKNVIHYIKRTYIKNDISTLIFLSRVTPTNC